MIFHRDSTPDQCLSVVFRYSAYLIRDTKGWGVSK